MNNIEKAIVHFVSKELGATSLTPDQTNYALSIYRSINPRTFIGHRSTEVAPALGKVIADDIRSRQDAKNTKRVKRTSVPLISSKTTPEPSFDLHEYQNSVVSEAGQEVEYIGNMVKTASADGNNTSTDINDDTLLQPTENKVSDVSINKFMGIDDLNTIKLLFNPESMYVHYYIVLDSDFRDKTAEVSTNITKFTWQYAATQNLKTGFCNSVGVIRDIVGMRMYQPRVPYLAGMDTSAKRVSVLIEEFGAQAFNAENGRRFHFLLRPNFLGGQTSIELSTEDFNDGIYNFRLPITTVSSFTVSFADPLNILTFSEPFDRFIIPFEFVCLKSDK